jgi:hypothetical protein
LAEYGELEGISWKWQSVDGTNVEAPLAKESVGPNPTDQGRFYESRKRPRFSIVSTTQVLLSK